MKTSTIKQFKIIETDNAKDFESMVNKTMTELSKNHPEINIDVNAGFKAFISYTISIDIPETVSDRYSMQGIKYRCSNCPNCIRFTNSNGSIDMRRKRAVCSREGYCNIRSEACEWFYDSLSKGTIEPICD